MERREIKGESFGQRQPPLTELIKSILERYPDGGQILKELIQNADDAGATEVKFQYDCRSYGSRSLVSRELSKFQGPALYAYNNAKFKPEDWEGIQNVMRSGKKDNPLKVGRFGIGFNSVYHITDLPGIVSGDTIGFLDPHERYFQLREPGQKYKMSDGLLDVNCTDQFAPFHGIFGCDLAQAKNYDSTLFRFPLRTETSELSEKKYTKEMIEGLFESLRKEASVILLFLKSVESISVHERKEDGEMECVFKVEVAPETRDDVRRKRLELIQNALKPGVILSRFVIDIQVISTSPTHSFKWLIVHQIGSTEKRISELAVKLHLLPWVGLAVPLNDEAINEGVGRIFCFLPLPPDEECKTGLPVHVHGYFGLTDNRRGLAWPGSDRQNSETAEWNKLLLTKIGSTVYCKILESLVEDEPRTGVNDEPRSRLVYSTLPNLNDVRGLWNCILQPLFEQLENQKLFYAQSTSGNSWNALKDGCLDRFRPGETKTQNAVVTFLRQFVPVFTDLPSHVLQIVDHVEYFSTFHNITPAIVRSIVKRCGIGTTGRQEKVLLLGYVLSDGQVGQLTDLPLLPLANDEFATFHVHSHAANSKKSVFVPSGGCTAVLLPNMKDRFLYGSLAKDTAQKLHDVAAHDVQKQNPTQLVRLTTDIVLDNLRASLPSEWLDGKEKVQWTPGCSNHPEESWLEAVWLWIQTSFQTSLGPLRGIPLIPLPTHSHKSLGVLSEKSRFIFASDASGEDLPETIVDFLTACKCTVLSGVPSFVRHRSLATYIATASPAGVLKVISRCILNVVQEYITQVCDPTDRALLRSFFCRLPSISNNEKKFLLQLPLFHTLNGTVTAVQVDSETRKAVSPDFILPSGLTLSSGSKLISTSDDSSRNLLSFMKITILKPADVFIQCLFPNIRENSVYTAQETDRIMMWILARMVTFSQQNKEFVAQMKALPFVPTKTGKRRTAAALFASNDPVLRDLFVDEPERFPTGTFATNDALLRLKELGLRTREDLTGLDLFKCAEAIESSRNAASSLNKAKALVEILNANPGHLNQSMENRQLILKDFLRLIKWIPCATVPPPDYPEIMPWKHSIAYFAPAEIRSSSEALLIGSSMATLGAEMSENLQQEFALPSQPPVDQVVRQLKIAVESWQVHQGETLTTTFEIMLAKIYHFLATVDHQTLSRAIQSAHLESWIWHGRGFCSPAQVALHNDFPLDLRPQLFVLPDSFKGRSLLVEFFCRHGVRRRFSKQDMLGVLVGIRDKHAKDPFDDNSAKEVDRDMDICCAILQLVVRDNNTLSDTMQEKVLVPVQSAKNVLVLEPCKKCTYCDHDWLRRGGSELDIPGEYFLIHESVPLNVARLLGVTALSTCLASAEPLGFEFEQTGPYEPITTRLNNILKEYKEGVGIFKELIQNADDAGASKVRFLVDWRHGPKQKLLSLKMAECQGPALWAYNNAVFSDKDFENINKLAGATKEEDLAKIGRFGLGFNAVYHLTDVPSFVSREYFVVFDPNVHHLQRHIKDKSRPGMKINLATSPIPLSTFEDQFQPYHDVFGCKTQGTESGKFFYDGTLFRFPFRTMREARESEICQSVYDDEKIKAIVSSLKDSASLLLLYTQRVMEVELYEVTTSSDAEKMQLVLSITKPKPQIIRNETSVNDVPFIEECSNWWAKKRKYPNWLHNKSPSRCELVTIDTKQMVSDLITSAAESEKQELWLVTSSVGTEASVRLASHGEGRKHNLLPCAGAAAQLKVVTKTPKDSLKFRVAPAQCGEAFCFLPLSIPTGLPVHVNGYFALTSNRMGLWKRSTLVRHQPVEVRWNDCLMEDALANAYIQLLKDVKYLSECGHLEQYDFYSLWPHYDKYSSSWGILVNSVYNKLVNNDLPLLCSDSEWLSLKHGYVLGESLWPVDEVVDILKHLEQPVFRLPPLVSRSLHTSGHGSVLVQQTLTLESFLQNFFFPNISILSRAQRDAVVCFGLDYILREKRKSIVNMFRENRYITVSMDGRHLARPSELINPNGAAASLFSSEDRRFPIGEDFLTDDRVYVLERLGMVRDQLSWHEIIQRAKSVEKLANFQKKKERAKNLIKYLEKNIEQLTKADSDSVTILRRTEFLPIMLEPPDGYFLPWQGCRQKKQFVAPVNLFLPSDMELVGSSSSIVDDSNDTGCGHLGKNVKDLLGCSGRRPEIKLVIRQLHEAIDAWSMLSDKKDPQKHMVEAITKKVYKYLDSLVRQIEENLRQSRNKERQRNDEVLLENLLANLRRKNWLFIQGQFVPSRNVAYYWNRDGAPFLYGLPEHYRRNYNSLMRVAGVKETFEESDFINALYVLQETKKSLPLSEEELKLAACFLNELKDVNNDTIKKHVGKIPLPDTNKVLHQSDNLTINLNFWLKDREEDRRYVHRDIPQELALDLGARSLQSRILKKYTSTIGISFGQHEKLTDRLKNILQSYPSKYGILKELVQNADDAQASEIHFVYDTRVHPSERVIQKNAIEIQGPALCVYNDRPFTDKDLEGIQNLGTGSKRDDLEKTGRYGIGFNAVYHLTDCPSFLSNDDTLVFLDPHCRYTSEAKPDEPGARFHPIDDEFRENFPDVFVGYLGEYFELKGSTMFRLPLRDNSQSSFESLISTTYPNERVMRQLFDSFQEESKNLLLFLNHIKKITLWTIGLDNALKRIYEVSSVLDKAHEEQRKEISSVVKTFKNTPTSKIPWKGTTYPMTISDSNGLVEKWLINQCIGTPQARGGSKDDATIPDGRQYGLFPRGGIAALLPSSNVRDERRYVTYCFLPLPTSYTSLPVHINGHFALDTSRRNLWEDTNGVDPRTKWNNFVKSRVLPPGYAALIREAKNYIPGCERGPSENAQFHLANGNTTQFCLHWYHNLFPNASTDKAWKRLAFGVYHFLGMTKAPVLPVVVTDEASMVQDSLPQRIHSWVSADTGFFVHYRTTPEELPKLLLRIHLPVLVHSPLMIYWGFQYAQINPRLVDPKSVIVFLQSFLSKNSTCQIGNLPCKLEATNVRSIPELRELIKYCATEESFATHLEGLPLLLTADGQLRVFDSSKPVFRTPFGDLFPDQRHRFIHAYVLYDFPDVTDNAKSVMRQFKVSDLAVLLASIFDPSMKGITTHIRWLYPDEGVLSKAWFRRLWAFLQNYAKPEQNEQQVSLKALKEWPIIPTTSEELVTIDNAKTVLDMTPSATGIARGKKVREILQKAQCPSLEKDITFEKPHPAIRSLMAPSKFLERNTAVTDPYVAHPHCVADVLQVLNFMRKSGTLDVSKLRASEIRELLEFFQDDCKNLQPKSYFNAILKTLPFYKALDCTHVSLSASSYALVPSGVPVTELEKLQRHTDCLFLHSDASPALDKLYKELGAGAERTVSAFYTDYILQYFSIFSQESQMEHLIHVRDEVLPNFPQTSKEKQKFLEVLQETRCLPDENGKLHYAKEFYDPSNEVFQIMLNDNPNNFPPLPFQEHSWNELLKQIGLQQDVNKELFLVFCQQVAQRADQYKNDKVNVEKSRVLVRHLFENPNLHDLRFLSTVSAITFIASAKVEENLSTIYRQYQCQERGEQPPFVQFRKSVPCIYKKRVWSSAQLLPRFAEPKFHGANHLGILKEPSVRTVVTHLKNISTALAQKSKREELWHLVKDIMTEIYSFLAKSMKCNGKEATQECTEDCKDIGRHLKTIACVLVEEDKVLVKGEQLSFHVPGDNVLKPFLYKVPREYGNFEHFLKRLGVTEMVTLRQLANVLKAIKRECNDEQMGGDNEMKAKCTMHLFFSLAIKGDRAVKLSDITELYLPSEDKRLIKSNELACKVPPRLAKVITELNFVQVLLKMEKCKLAREKEDDYINALPEELRPVPLETLVREELDPSCIIKCPYGQDGAICDFLHTYTKLLTSKEFQEGLERLIKHYNLNKLSDEDRKKLARLRSPKLKIECTGEEKIKIRLVDRKTERVLEGSHLEDICCVVKGTRTWTLYIQHNFGGKRTVGVLSKCINEIIDGCLSDLCMGVFTDMLLCDSPSEITTVLDSHNIEESLTPDDLEFTPPDFEFTPGDKEEVHPGTGSVGPGRPKQDKHPGGRPSSGSGGVRIDKTYFPGDENIPPNRDEARRWIKQSNSDLAAAEFLHSADRQPFGAMVCFLSHQIVEKSLKAALYAQCGLTNNQLHTHNVNQLAVDVNNGTRVNVVHLADGVSDYYLNTRYPNRQPKGRVPAEQFGEREAERAMETTNELLEVVETFIDEKDFF